jgi:hypothetical protein
MQNLLAERICMHGDEYLDLKAAVNFATSWADISFKSILDLRRQIEQLFNFLKNSYRGISYTFITQLLSEENFMRIESINIMQHKRLLYCHTRNADRMYLIKKQGESE